MRSRRACGGDDRRARPRDVGGVAPRVPARKTFPWFNSALMRLNHRRSTTKSANVLRPSGRRAFSSSAAATSCTTCTHTHGAGTPSSPISGLWRSRRESANCCSRRKPSRSSTTENKLGEEAMLAIPTPDYYLPLLYVIGTRTPSELVTFPVEGVDGGSISMLAVRVG